MFMVSVCTLVLPRSFGKERILKKAMEKFSIFAWRNSKNIFK